VKRQLFRDYGFEPRADGAVHFLEFFNKPNLFTPSTPVGPTLSPTCSMIRTPLTLGDLWSNHVAVADLLQLWTDA